MFSRELLSIINLHSPVNGIYRGLSFTTYPPYAFNSESSEETIIISRAPKLLQDSGFKFWIAAVLNDDWSDREEFREEYIVGANFEEIPEKTLNARISRCCADLIVKPKVPLAESPFVGAIEMYYENDGVTLVDMFAEYEKEFVRFYWDTTA